ncbi:MAG: cation:dicarboxylase symporter family transporter [Alphaproteobacteria bacterium]|nr:cation:dicarboxylase symporter family transporter [Alphaproteobacteria bacterium]
MFKSLSVRVVLALLLGVAAGAFVRTEAPGLEAAAGYVEAFGGLWLNALRMTVVPLVFSLVVIGIASVADAAATGRLAARAVLLFSVLLVGAAAYSIAATGGLLTVWSVDADAARAFLGAAPPAAEAAPASLEGGFARWLQSLAPSNPIAAAAEEAILPLVIFAIFFGFAATRLGDEQKTAIVTLFRAIAEAMIVIVQWVLIAAPLGVFALSLGVGLRAGFGAVGVLAHYVTVVSLVTLGITIVALLLAVTWGRAPIARFAAAAGAPLAVAFSTQSSLASLPAMLEAARAGLGVPRRVTDLVLPLAVAVFRFTSPVANLAVALYIASLYGIAPTPLALIGAIVVAFAVSVGSVGLPGQVSFIASMTPICIALGVPIELLGVLLAVEVVPDIFRTLGNVSGDLAATLILSDKKERDAETA